MKDRGDEQLISYLKLLEGMSTEELVGELFSYLDAVEESDSGREFHPVTISSCRVGYQQTLGAVLRKLREVAV
jgi:hypothetical protein